MKNNLFYYATSELSQDAFICWLASFALEDAKPDQALRECAREMLTLFVPELKGHEFTLRGVRRQEKNIDVLLSVASGGKEYKIVVEDKTYTNEHDNQLIRYLDYLRDTYPGCIACGVYYKTGFQSDLSQVKQAGYRIVTRAHMLELLSAYTDKTVNQIFLDYFEYWNDFHRNALLYQTLPLSRWDWSQIYAFYDDLQNGGFGEKREVWIGYGYVANRSGGFRGLWTGTYDDYREIRGVRCELYLQIEPEWNYDTNGYIFPICLKLAPKPASGQDVLAGDIRNAVVYDASWKYRLSEFHFSKPRRFASGRHMTIGRYDASCKDAVQLENVLSTAIEDYKRLLDCLKNHD